METAIYDEVKDFIATISSVSQTGDVTVAALLAPDRAMLEQTIPVLVGDSEHVALLPDDLQIETLARTLHELLEEGKIVLIRQFTPVLKQQLWSLVNDRKLSLQRPDGTFEDGTIYVPGAAVLLLLTEAEYDELQDGGIISLVERM